MQPFVWLSLLTSAVLVITLNALKIDIIWSLVAVCITASVVFSGNERGNKLIEPIMRDVKIMNRGFSRRHGAHWRNCLPSDAGACR